MLVSANVDHRRLFADLQAVVVDEVHVFGSGDRGWHLLAVLERLTRLCGRPLQRIGMSVTVGNPAPCSCWLQGSSAGKRLGTIVAAEAQQKKIKKPNSYGNSPTDQDLDVQLDYVGTVENAARVISALHRERSAWCSAIPSAS